MRLYVITGSQFLSPGVSLASAVEAALRGGADAVQMREKELSGRRLVELGRELKRVCQAYGAPFIVNDRVDVAMLCEADGVHVGQDDIDARDVRSLLGNDGGFFGVSAKRLDEARRAESAGASYLGVGPAYTTGTKKDAGDALPLSTLGEICRKSRIPVVAIGGIIPGKAAPLIDAGAHGVAVISAVFGRSDIEAAARELRREVDGALARRESEKREGNDGC